MEYITAVEFRWGAGYVCRAASVECLELCDKYSIGWTAEVRSTLRFGRCIADIHRMSCTPAGRKTRLRAWQLLMRSVKSAFALLLAKVTKHIPPQTSPVGSSLAGIWSAVGRFLCETLYYNLYNRASGNSPVRREKSGLNK